MGGGYGRDLKIYEIDHVYGIMPGIEQHQNYTLLA
jgi:hypothetical protein